MDKNGLFNNLFGSELQQLGPDKPVGGGCVLTVVAILFVIGCGFITLGAGAIRDNRQLALVPLFIIIAIMVLLASMKR